MLETTFAIQFQIALGGDASDIETNYNGLMTFLFLISAFVSAVTFLNMLVGIMGTTQGRVLDEQDRNALIERTKIYNDFFPLMQQDVEFKGK